MAEQNPCILKLDILCNDRLDSRSGHFIHSETAPGIWLDTGLGGPERWNERDSEN
jgi:hypothetical protein